MHVPTYRGLLYQTELHPKLKNILPAKVVSDATLHSLITEKTLSDSTGFPRH